MFAIPAPAPVGTTSPLIFFVCSLHAALERFMATRSDDLAAHGGVPYTPEEEGVIRQFYVTHGIAYCHRLIPRHTEFSIIRKARRLGIKRWDRRAWTDEEERLIRISISSGCTLSCISGALHEAGFERTPVAVRDFINTRKLRT